MKTKSQCTAEAFSCITDGRENSVSTEGNLHIFSHTHTHTHTHTYKTCLPMPK